MIPRRHRVLFIAVLFSTTCIAVLFSPALPTARTATAHPIATGIRHLGEACEHEQKERVVNSHYVSPTGTGAWLGIHTAIPGLVLPAEAQKKFMKVDGCKATGVPRTQRRRLTKCS